MKTTFLVKTVLLALILSGILAVSYSEATYAVESTQNVTKAVNTMTDDIVSVIRNIIIGIGVVMLMVGAVYMITSKGNPNRLAKGKETVTYALAGIVLVAFASMIITYVFSLSSSVAGS